MRQAFATDAIGWTAAAALALCCAPLAAQAQCTASGPTVTCTGSDPDGFGDGTQAGFTVTVESGASVAGSPPALGSIWVGSGNTIRNHGTITAGVSGFGILANQFNTIANSGSILVGDSATAILAGDLNTLTNTGTITAGNAGTGVIAGSGNTITNSGSLTVGNSTAFTSTGIQAQNNNSIVNNGSITGGSGATGITANSFNSIVNNGAIRVGSGGTGILAFTGNTVVNNGTVTAGRDGFSILALAGNTITNNGTLDGQLRAPGANTVTNSGLVTVTNSATAVGVEHMVGGTFTQTGSGILDLRFSDTTGDRLTVGAANLGGTLRTLLQPGLYGSTTTYRVVTGQVAGRFGQVELRNADGTGGLAFFTAAATYNANSADVTLTRIGFDQTPTTTPNGRAVGRGLEAAYSTTLTGSARTFFTTLLQAGSADALDALSGAGTAAAQNAAFFAGGLFRTTALDQALAWRTEARAPAGSAAPLAYASAENPDALAYKAPAAAHRPWQAWVAGLGGSQRLDADTLSGPGVLRSDAGGLAAGVDYAARPDLLLGASVGGSTSQFSVPERATSGDVDAVHLGLYGVYRFDAAYLAAVASYSRFSNATRRSVAGFGVPETLTADFDTAEVAGRLEIGRTWSVAAAQVTPFAAIEVAGLWSDGHAESSVTAAGAPGVFGLTHGASTEISVPASFGAQIDAAMVFDRLVWSPYARLAWVHEFNARRRFSAAVTAVPGSWFTGEGVPAAEDSARLEIGSRLAFSPNAALVAGLTGDVSGRGHAYSARGALRVAW